ncbi:MAG: ATP--guanido phosphotransferase, partial [Planctomycetes bacterium]|nr:ATP--guanido phosphotransferase [Planctomycetota bacterium]
MSPRSRKNDRRDDGGDRVEPHDEWLRGDGPDEDVVVCTRVRLARNVEGHGFSITQDDEKAAAVTATITEALEPLAREQGWDWFDIRELSALERRCLVERHLISRELEEADRARGVMFDARGRSSVMINEEDHLRIQVFRSGLRMDDAFAAADAIDDEISDRLAYAWSNEFGFLTSCPTNTGTGLRISVLMHLPALVTAKEIEKATNAIHEMNMTVRG